ncbi:M23 family metallopeptidase [Nonomuraea roseola]|uniref:M23 family metallopeptidase n=1 Tax=Nonomuraea roseola TaxID=46179 RepID=A0ABV5QAA1_9ACTN
MRSGRLSAVVVGAVLLAGGCGQATGVAGVSMRAPAMAADPSADPSGDPSGDPSAAPSGTPTGAASTPGTEHQSGVQRPAAADPVKVPPPKVSKYDYAFPVKGCKTNYQRKLLIIPKTTIWAARGCSFVAPVDGVIDEVNINNRWKPSTDVGSDREGRFVSIIGEDGVRYLGGHLDSVTEGLTPGAKVKAGQELGKVGNTGNARDTAPNLYFAISWKTGPAYWWVRRGMVEPWDYLDAWLKGNPTLSPKEETFKLRRKLGETPACTTLCSSRSASSPPQEEEKEKERKKKPSTPTQTPTPPPLNDTGTL